MKTFLLFLCLVASTFVVPARSKPQSKHQISSKKLQETEGHPEQSMRNLEVLPTFITFEASSQEQEDEDVSYDGNGGEPREKSAPVLLSEEALADLLERSEEEPGQSEESQDEGGLEAVDGDEGGVEDVADVDGEEGDVEAVDGEEGGVDTDAPENNPSTEAEIPTEMDYSEDGDGLEEANDPGLPSEEEASDEVPEGATDASLEEGKAGDSDSLEEGDQALLGEGNGLRGAPGESQSESRKHQGSRNGDALEAKNGVEPGGAPGSEAGAGAERNDSGSQAKYRARKLRKNQRASLAGAERRKSQLEIVPNATDNTVQKSQKKNSGKWVPLVGMNPVQIRATEELYPHDAAHQDQGVQEVPVNPCEGFRCKRGKTCQVNQGKRPSCICQDPATCIPSLTEFDHVCGTDNKTYDTSCQLFATKCNLEGTKRGHRLHLDYTGNCKYIAPCLDSELDQFPLRMRDWLKNVLLQLYEHDTRSPGFLTPKQRLRVQKIHESERRLHAGDHPIEMLARDFEKNYNMYIYPVHWQFAQMDQHPSDRLLSHSELAPLRVPLVPMEHCTSRFFQECDADKDKQVSLEEWCHCFGIQDEDMDVSLLF